MESGIRRRTRRRRCGNQAARLKKNEATLARGLVEPRKRTCDLEAACVREFTLLEALPAEHRPALRWSEGDRGFLAARRAVGCRLDAFPRDWARGRPRRPLCFA